MEGYCCRRKGVQTHVAAINTMQSISMVINTSKQKAAATLLIAACIGATLYDDGLTLFLPSSTDYDPQFLRRSLMSSSEQLYFGEDDEDNIGMYPWAQYHLRPVDVKPDAEKETALFWHIPKVRVSVHILCLISPLC